MKPLKIGILEEQVAIAKKILYTLEKLGYAHCAPVINYAGAIKMLDEENPDLLLLGSVLTSKQEGIEIALQVSELCKIPIVFLAAESNAETINRIIQVKPHSYMLVPFDKDDLFAAIEIAFRNFTNNRNKAKDKKIALWAAQDFIFVKCGYAYHKVFFKDIIYLESDGNYVTIQLQTHKKVLIRSTLKDFTAQSEQKIFLRVHRSYLVNIHKIEEVFPSIITINGYKIPVGKSYKKAIYTALGIGKN